MKFKKYLKRKKLTEIFKTKLSKKLSMGTDGITTNKFSEILDDEITIIKRKVKNETYSVSPYKEKLILKNRDSKPRMISIPTNRDRLTFRALTEFITDSFKDDLHESSIHSMILDINKNIKSNKYDSFIKLDIKDFYPSLDHDILMVKIETKIDDSKAISLIKKAISKYTIAEGRIDKTKLQELTKGVPQGLSFSSVLSSIYMTELNNKYRHRTDLAFYRFVDDVLILCNTEDLEAIKSDIVQDMNDLNLQVHTFKHGSDKSSSGTIGIDRFQYLGYEFFNNTVSVRESSLDTFYNSIVKVFQTASDEDELYYNLNHKITGCVYHNKKYGWLSFFALIDDVGLLHKLDAFVKKKFKQHKIAYSEEKIKKFVKTYFELKNIEKSSYIPKYPITIKSRPKHSTSTKSQIVIKSRQSGSNTNKLKIVLKELKKDMEFY